MNKPVTMILGSLLLTAALAACSSAPGGGVPGPTPAPTPAPGPTPTPGDTSAPSVVSVSPADGDIGVKKDASVVITFSEPMNQASAQAGFQSASLGAVTFSWNAEGTVMTVKPNTALSYTSGGQAYSFSETTTATDRAGNPLGAAKNVGFKTLREITTTLIGQGSDGHVRNDNTVVNTTSIAVGDYTDNQATRGFVSFDLSGLPAGLTPDGIQKANLRLYVNTITGTPFTDLFPPVTCTPFCFFKGKSVVVESVQYGAGLSGSSFDLPALGDPMGLYGEGSGPILFLGTTTEWNSTNALNALRADWQERASRGSRSQYRLKFPLGTDADNAVDRIYLDSASATHKPQLVVTYLIP